MVRHHMQLWPWAGASLSIAILLWMSSLGVAHAGAFKETRSVDESLINDVLDAAEKAVKFFEQDYSELNMDGLYGIRIGQGKIIESLEACSSNDFNCPVDQVSRLEVMREKVEDIAEKALPYIMDQDAFYASRFIHTIEAPYQVSYIPEWLGEDVVPIGDNIMYLGPLGDKCFGKMMGTFLLHNGIPDPSCSIDEKCWNFMTKPGTRDYFVTHQLLYLIYGEKSGCLSVLEDWAKGTSVRDMQREYCGRIYSEAKWLSENGTVEMRKRDLFIEQAMLCGLIGFQDFTNEPWIHMVIRWQMAEGCWGTPKDFRTPFSYGLTLESAAEVIKASQRKLMTESPMMGDCLSHESGLAFGTLGVYLRGLIHQLYKMN